MHMVRSVAAGPFGSCEAAIARTARGMTTEPHGGYGVPRPSRGKPRMGKTRAAGEGVRLRVKPISQRVIRWSPRS